MSARQRHLGAACVVGAATLWGFWPVWTRGAASGAACATIALLVSAVVGLPLVLAGPRRAAPRSRLAWPLLGALSVGYAANTWCYFRALAEGAIAPAVLSHYLAPVLIALAAPRVLGEPRHRLTWVALLAALGGTAILLLGSQAAAGSAEQVRIALVLGGASAIFYATTVLISKRLAGDFSNAELMVFQGVAAGLILLPVTGLQGPWLLPVIGGVVSSLIAGLLYYAGLRRLPAERAGVLAYLEPVMAILVGWAVFGEQPGVAAAAGGALVLGGGFLVVSQPTDRTSRESE